MTPKPRTPGQIASERKRPTVSVRFSPEEREQVETMAKAMGLDTAAFIRSAALRSAEEWRAEFDARFSRIEHLSTDAVTATLIVLEQTNNELSALRTVLSRMGNLVKMWARSSPQSFIVERDLAEARKRIDAVTVKVVRELGGIYSELINAQQLGGDRL